MRYSGLVKTKSVDERTYKNGIGNRRHSSTGRFSTGKSQLGNMGTQRYTEFSTGGPDEEAMGSALLKGKK